jgi:hypothetical protein
MELLGNEGERGTILFWHPSFDSLSPHFELQILLPKLLCLPCQRCVFSILTNGMLLIDHLEEESKLIEAAFQYVLCSEEDDAAIYRQKKYLVQSSGSIVRSNLRL